MALQRYITIQPSDVSAESIMTDESLILTYNRLLNASNSWLNEQTKQTLKIELVKRNIITEDHEGLI